MAHVEKTTIERTVTEDGYILTLNENEARTLRLILGFVGGLPANTIRKYMNEVLDALDDAEVQGVYPHSPKDFVTGRLELIKDFE